MKFLRPLRRGIGSLIILADKLTSPTPAKRAPELQKAIDQQMARLALYEFDACPFCVKVRRAMKRLNISIERRDAANNPHHRKALLEGGGKVQVPCLLLADGKWLYESNDIIKYLEDCCQKAMSTP